jgi:hypothetical protein
MRSRTEVAKCVLKSVDELYEILVHDYQLCLQLFSDVFVFSWKVKVMMNGAK